jgi:hypothetical protein
MPNEPLRWKVETSDRYGKIVSTVISLATGALGACPRNHFMSHMLCAYKTPTTSNCGYDMPILNTRTRS